MITVIVGKPGSGKSYWLALKAKEILSDSKESREIWANFKINDNRVHYYDNFLDLADKKDIVIFMDEADENMDARDWKDLPVPTRRKFRQHRHHAIDIYLASQDFGFIDISIRKLTARYLEIKKVVGSSEKRGVLPAHPWGLFFLREYSPFEYDKVRRKLVSWHFFWGSPEIYHFYDTYEDISDLLTQSDRIDIKQMAVRVCSKCGSKRIVGY